MKKMVLVEYPYQLIEVKVELVEVVNSNRENVNVI
jgi:hypothetical protein